MKVEILNNHLTAVAKAVMKASVILRRMIYSLELIKSLELATKERLPCNQVALAVCDCIVWPLLGSQGLYRLVPNSDRLYIVFILKCALYNIFAWWFAHRQAQCSSSLALLIHEHSLQLGAGSHLARGFPHRRTFLHPWHLCPILQHIHADRVQSSVQPADCSTSVDGKNKLHLTSAVDIKLSRYWRLRCFLGIWASWSLVEYAGVCLFQGSMLVFLWKFFLKLCIPIVTHNWENIAKICVAYWPDRV